MKVKVEEVNDSESLQSWIEGQLDDSPESEVSAHVKELVSLVRYRACLRMLPTAWTRSPEALGSLHKNTEDAFLIALQGALWQVLDALGPPDIKHRGVAGFVHSQMKLDGTDPIIVVMGWDIAAAVFHLGQYESQGWEIVRDDINSALLGRIENLRLWPNKNPLADVWRDIRNKLLAQGEGWRFWVDWYDNALLGRPQDIPLLTKIARIDAADWDKGSVHVNALIQQIIYDHKPKPKLEPPELTNLERSHIALVLSAPDPARQSAEFLRDQFQRIESAYIQAMGCPNEIPPEIEPIATLARCFGVIATLLRETRDNQKLVADLIVQIRILEANNAALRSALQGSQRSFLRDAASATVGGVMSAMIISTTGYLGGPFMSEGLGPLWDLLKPAQPPRHLPLPPITEV